MEYLSPLRYPGGKARVSDFMQCVIRDNALQGGTYAEPYVGGGSVALSLLFSDSVQDIYINDKDLSIYAFWYSVLNETEELCKLIQETPVDIDSWNSLREVQQHKNDVDLLSLGFSTFFLNRTNRSGILKAGVIGGKNQDGNYKIDARYNKERLINRILRIANYRERIRIYNEDAITFVNHLSEELPNSTLFYLDPPYYVKGKGLYMNYYDDQDHRDVAQSIGRNNLHKWIVSYDNVDFIKGLYQLYRHKTFKLNYSASNSGKGEEIMFFSNNLIIPEHDLFESVQ